MEIVNTRCVMTLVNETGASSQQTSYLVTCIEKNNLGKANRAQIRRQN